MFKTERLSKIKELIMERGQMDVNTLHTLLGVSEVTIRSDLEQLEKENFIYRRHGGAILNENSMKQHNFQEMLFGGKLKYDKNKEYIGKVAAELVKEGEWIFIGQGSTCYYIAKELAAKDNLNVLTNNLCAAAILAQNSKSKIIVTGGNLVHEHMFLAGDMLLRSLENVFISTAFMGVSGIDFKGGFTVCDASELHVYEKIKTITERLIIIGDETKFGKPSFISIGDLSMPDAVITNRGVPKEYEEYFVQYGVQVYY